MLEYFIVSLADVYTMILFVYVLMSWIPQKSGIIADIDTVLGRVCDPFLNLFRKFIPPIGGWSTYRRFLPCLYYNSLYV